jgi:hypothetical protein
MHPPSLLSAYPIKLLRASAIASVAFLASCTTPAENPVPGADASTSGQFTQHQYANGRVTTVGTFSGEALWKRTVDERIANEKAGRRPDATGGISWRQQWQEWYAIIRHYPTPGFASSQFKTSEDMVRYMKRKRREAGLPAYDP